MKVDNLNLELGTLQVHIASLDPTKHHSIHVRIGDETDIPSPDDLKRVAAFVQQECDAAKINVSVFATASALEIDVIEA